MGAPSKFTKEREELILNFAKSGAIDKEIAEKAKIKAKSIQNWMDRNPDFFLLLKEAKEFTNDLAEGSLLKLALGYKREVVKVAFTRDGLPCEHRYEIEEPPNITALIFWLKNRRPDTWRNNSEALKLGENLLEIIMNTQIEKKADMPIVGQSETLDKGPESAVESVTESDNGQSEIG